MSSPSSLGREAACMASVVLPHTGSASPHAWRGTELHRFMANVAKLGRDAALADCDEKWREAARAIDLSLFPPLNPETGRAEVKLAWDPASGLASPVRLKDPDEPLRDDHLFVGTVDWLALTEDAVVVIDWKFGFLSVAPSDVNLQIMAYAVMAAAAFNRSRAVVGIGRVLENGEPWFDVTTLDEFGLATSAARLRTHLRKVDEAKSAFKAHGVVPKPVEGDHCRYCPAYAHCPAKARLAVSALSGELTREVALTVEVAGELYPKLLEARRLVEKLIDDVEGFAKLQRVPLPNGLVLGLVTKEVRSLEPQLTADYLAGHLPDVKIGDVVKHKTTAGIGDLEAAIKASLAPGQKLAPTMRTVEADMGRTGALRVFVGEAVRAVKPDSKRLLPEKAPATLTEALQASVEGASK